MLKENKLRAKIAEHNLSIKQLALMMGVNAGTFYRKMLKNSFFISEVDKIAEILKLTAEEAVDIFFASIGA